MKLSLFILNSIFFKIKTQEVGNAFEVPTTFCGNYGFNIGTWTDDQEAVFVSEFASDELSCLISTEVSIFFISSET